LKCPKCDYLGFETGDRCRNCGYDFSLLALAEPAADLPLISAEPDARQPAAMRLRDAADGIAQSEAPDLDLVLAIPSEREASTPDVVAEAATEPLVTAFESTQSNSAVASPDPAASTTSHLRVASRANRAPAGLPLFPADAERELDPLLHVPAAPRAPVAVRRGPDLSRFKSALSPRPALPADELFEPVATDLEEPVAPRRQPVVVVPSKPRHAKSLPQYETSPPGPRAAAVLVDTAILLAIDGIVLYLTTGMAQLPMDQWRELPLLPLSLFLALLAFGYHAAFTAFGGQTIGKMAAGIRVVSADNTAMDPRKAVTRTLAATISVITLGLAYAPVFAATDGRALHDRLAKTRVVTISPA
jgi:uncharacterized RDD family membrane protein YckC